jgi:hypothetical protein
LVGIICFFAFFLFRLWGGQFSFSIVHQSAWKPIYMKFLGSPLWIYRSTAAVYMREKNKKTKTKKVLAIILRLTRVVRIAFLLLLVFFLSRFIIVMDHSGCSRPSKSSLIIIECAGTFPAGVD